VAMLVEDALMDAGFGIIGPAATVEEAMRRGLGDGGDVAERFAGGAPMWEASPIRRAPLPVPVLLTHGTADDSVPPDFSSRFAERGGEVTLSLREGEGHMEHIDPASAAWAEAVAWLRRNGEDHTAALTEIGGASGLLSTGRFGEHDAAVSALADRYRAEGPPTLLYVALTLLGYSASFQGDPERAGRLFDESAGIDVPDRTISVNAPIDARSAFRRGDRPRAFQILRSHVDELLRTGNTDIAGNAAVEFITMMASIDRLDDAARVLRFLETAGDFGALAARTVVAEAAGKIATAAGPAPGSEPPPGHQLDARQALDHMHDVLNELTPAQPL